MKKHPDYCLRPQVKGNAVETRSLLKLISVVWRPYCAVFMLGALKKKPRVHSVIAPGVFNRLSIGSESSTQK